MRKYVHDVVCGEGEINYPIGFPYCSIALWGYTYAMIEIITIGFGRIIGHGCSDFTIVFLVLDLLTCPEKAWGKLASFQCNL